jgi:hypothetical protein
LGNALMRPPCRSMIERQIDSPIPIGGESDTAVGHRDSHVLCVFMLQSNHELARSIRDRLHGFDAVEHQIEDHLLQLNFIGENDWERARAFHAQRHPGALQQRR